MSSSILPRFSSKSFKVSGLTFRSLIHLILSLCMVLGSVLISFFYTVLPATFMEEIFSPLYILASFIKHKVPIGAWVYFWASYLVRWSAFLFLCQYYTVLMTVALQCNLKSGRLISPAPFFFLKIALAIWGPLCFYMN